MMIKGGCFLVVLVVLSMISVCCGAPVSFGFSGSLQNEAQNVQRWAGINFEGRCKSENFARVDWRNYIAWNLYVDNSNATFYFVQGNIFNSSFSSDQLKIQLLIYTTFNPDFPCEGLYGPGLIYAKFTEDNGPQIYDGIGLKPGKYVLVVTTKGYTNQEKYENDEAIFAINFTPATGVINLNDPAGPLWYPSTSEFDMEWKNNSFCTSNNAFLEPAEIFGVFEFVAPDNDYYDIVALIVNSTYINPTVELLLEYEIQNNLAIYAGTVDTEKLGLHACQPNFVNGSQGEDILDGMDYVWLKKGQKYTIVASAVFEEKNVLGQIAIQVVPSLTRFVIASPTFSEPFFNERDLSCIESPNDKKGVVWYAHTFTAQYPIYLITTSEPLGYNCIFGEVEAQTYLYLLDSVANPPDSCNALVSVKSTNIDPIGYNTKIGAKYSFVVTDNSLDMNDDNYEGFRLYILTGTYVNNAYFVVPKSGGSSSVLSSSYSTGIRFPTTG
eukprot:TRINITY_DN15232_c0_g1_i1.p1 TRINITY_DN15232_c0_g1~~TRINITY_DN15232_c0_g1_i1.p1  ORF type:complete len:496 (+),score=90.64 TRINITY_DN15232_c0_g1_i1:234-1721(+)